MDSPGDTETADRPIAEAPAGGADQASLPEDVVETALLIGTLFRRMLSYGDGGSALRETDSHNLSFLEFKTMIELGAAEHQTMPCIQDIATATGASMPSVSRAIDNLVRKDLVSRIEDPEDRRRRMLTLTEEGTEIVNRVLLGRAAGALRLAASFEPDERAELNSLLGRLAQREDFARIYTQLEGAVKK